MSPDLPGGLGRVRKYELLLSDPTNSKEDIVNIAWAILNDLERCFEKGK